MAGSRCKDTVFVSNARTPERAGTTSHQVPHHIRLQAHLAVHTLLGLQLLLQATTTT
jgi:hypothetical protein